MTGTRLLLHETLHRHSVLLVNRSDRTCATGILASAGRHLFMLTAAHNLRNLDPRRLTVPGIGPLAPPAEQRDLWMSHALDLAYLRLRRAPQPASGIRPFPLTAPPVSAQERRGSVAICGYPLSLVRFDDRSGPSGGESFLLRGSLVGVRSWPDGIAEDGKNPHDHFLLRSTDGTPGPAVDPRGLSGAGVWSYHPLTQRDGRFRYQLFGIQTGVYRREQLLAGSFIDPLLTQIFTDFPP